MKQLPALDALLRAWLNDPRAAAVVSFAISAVFLGAAGWLIQRNLRHNEPGLRAPLALPVALVVAGTGLYGTTILPAPSSWAVAAFVCALAGSLFYFADRRRYVRDPQGRVVADRWEIVLAFAR